MGVGRCRQVWSRGVFVCGRGMQMVILIVCGGAGVKAVDPGVGEDGDCCVLRGVDGDSGCKCVETCG